MTSEFSITYTIRMSSSHKGSTINHLERGMVNIFTGYFFLWANLRFSIIISKLGAKSGRTLKKKRNRRLAGPEEKKCVRVALGVPRLVCGDGGPSPSKILQFQKFHDFSMTVATLLNFVETGDKNETGGSPKKREIFTPIPPKMINGRPLMNMSSPCNLHR